MSAEKIGAKKSAIIRKYCTLEAKVNDVPLPLLKLLTAVYAAHPHHRLRVLCAPQERGGECAALLEHAGEVILVGVWSRSGEPAVPDYVAWAKAVLSQVRLHSAGVTAEEHIGTLFWTSLVPATAFWVIVCNMVPPVWHGVLEFGRSYGMYWWIASVLIVLVTGWLFYRAIQYIYAVITIGVQDDLYLVNLYLQEGSE